MQSKMVNAQFPLGIEAHHCKLGACDRYSLADHDEKSQGGSFFDKSEEIAVHSVFE